MSRTHSSRFATLPESRRRNPPITRFSRTVISGKTVRSWGTKQTPAPRIWSGLQPPMFSPSNTTVPSRGVSKPEITSPVVGVSKVSQLEDLIAAAEIELEPADVAYLEELYQPVENLLSLGYS